MLKDERPWIELDAPNLRTHLQGNKLFFPGHIYEYEVQLIPYSFNEFQIHYGICDVNNDQKFYLGTFSDTLRTLMTTSLCHVKIDLHTYQISFTFNSRRIYKMSLPKNKIFAPFLNVFNFVGKITIKNQLETWSSLEFLAFLTLIQHLKSNIFIPSTLWHRYHLITSEYLKYTTHKKKYKTSLIIFFLCLFFICSFTIVTCTHDLW